MQNLFNQFLKEKTYLDGISLKTRESYSYAFLKFSKYASTFTGLKDFVIGMKEDGLTAGACNVYIRSINSFLTWCYQNKHTEEHLKIRLIKDNPRIMKTFTDGQIKAIIFYKPPKQERRLHTLLLVLADTGIRINEALSIKRREVDFDNLLITVTGKGNKERIIPFSVELRKKLYKFCSSHEFDLVFCNRHGGKLSYNNVRRDFKQLMAKLGIEGFDGSFHAFRRFFATNYARQEGNSFMLQKLLGHSSHQMSVKYCKLVTDDLSKAHGRTSVLNLYR